MKVSNNRKRVVVLATVSLIAALAVFVANEVLDSYIIDGSSERRRLGLDGSRTQSVGKDKHRRARRAKAQEMKAQHLSKQQHKHHDVDSSSHNFDPKSIAGKSYTDVEGVQKDGTYLMLYDEFHEGPDNDCIPLLRVKNQIKRIHYHFSYCQLFGEWQRPQ